ncbi:hypothetical protein [Vibrio ouci]|uniref:Uncharacterized protein n=1 Tax=Vibrio ouci TaxID=2499078 RepID=A0A4Y8W884_9VIBR|nr:hypothetical protein [Vibrio ouci]TFH89130.1 hypothetical protein ELS82_23910 [Vibrio ouci]
MDNYIKADFDEPFLFRTASKLVCDNTLKNGEIWLRTNLYYQQIEDKARVDNNEGLSSSKIEFPISVKSDNGVFIDISGDRTGTMGTNVPPHYLISLHGTSISKQQHTDFGGVTFGISSFSVLTKQIIEETSKQIKVLGYQAGPVSYQFTSLVQTEKRNGAILEITDNPPHYLSTVDMTALRKEPILPFIEQDEWRIVVFTNGFIKGDHLAPLKLKVDKNLFYEY